MAKVAYPISQYTATIETSGGGGGDIDAERAAREAADQALEQSIAAETTAREAADTALEQALADEVIARENSDASLELALDEAINKREVVIRDLNAPTLPLTIPAFGGSPLVITWDIPEDLAAEYEACGLLGVEMKNGNTRVNSFIAYSFTMDGKTKLRAAFLTDGQDSSVDTAKARLLFIKKTS